MTNQKLSTLQNDIPEKWRERYYIKRIGEDDIEISLQARDGILTALNNGVRFIQIGKFTLMLNSIKSIDPKWGSNNIPPRPKIRYINLGMNEKTGQVVREQNKEDIKELEKWHNLFGDKSSLSTH